MSEKPTNPKDAVGIKKAPISTVSPVVMTEVGLAMLEGARKYGRHNYREAGVRASVYVDALWRHVFEQWWDCGQDVDPDSGLNHITKAIATLMVLRDSMILGNWVDDRPPSMPEELIAEYNKVAGDIIERYPDAKPAFVKEDKLESELTYTYYPRTTDEAPGFSAEEFGADLPGAEPAHDEEKR